jgi:hypothetical protein
LTQTLQRASARIIVLAALVAAAPAVAATPSDTTDAIAWARRIVALRGQVVEARRASAAARADAPELAERAFLAAREMSDDTGMLDDAGFRSLFLEAQAVYEEYYGGVRTVALSGREISELREETVEALATGGGLPEPTASPAHLEEATTSVFSALAYPAAAAPVVAAQAGRLRRMLGDLGGLERRGRSYFRLIDRELDRRGLPRELRYIPVIESGLNPRAVSPAGAAGLWQLMPATGAQFGLDAAGRHDPARSTVAACRLLERLGAMFDGDWQLALAAYNWGPARVQSLVRRERRRLGRTPTFWDIARHMPAETRAYVPRFIAVAEAMEG